MKAQTWIVALVLGLGVLHVASAQEFGVDSTTNLGYSSAATSGVTFTQRLDGWYSLPFDPRGGGFNLKAHVEADVPAAFAADIDVLSVKLVYLQPSTDVKVLRWTLGRFAYTDATTVILNHPLDGSVLDFDFGSFDLRVSTGFTGLVTRATSGVVLSLADQDSTALLGTSRFVGAVETGWTFFENQTLTLEALAQQDMTPHDKLVDEWSQVYSASKGGKVDTQYITLKADGPVVERLFYDAAFTFEGGSTLSWLTDPSTKSLFAQYKPITAVLANAGLTYFVPDFFSSSFQARMLFASGDADATSTVEGNTADNSTMFVPITPTTLAVVFNPGLSNLGFYQLGASMKPLTAVPLVVVANLMAFHRLVLGAVNAPGVLRSGPGWLGEELDLLASWQPYSDLQVTASLGGYLPTAGTFASTVPSFQYAVKAGAKLSL